MKLTRVVAAAVAHALYAAAAVATTAASSSARRCCAMHGAGRRPYRRVVQSLCRVPGPPGGRNDVTLAAGSLPDGCAARWASVG